MSDRAGAMTVTSRGRLRLASAALVLLFHLSASAMAEQSLVIKVATMAPKGSLYHRVVQEIGERWTRAQGPNGKFIVYTDSSQGKESDVLRRMRVGQIQAGMLTVAGLREIEPSVTALQQLPLMFRSWEEFDYVAARLQPELERRMLAKGYVVLFWGEGGWIQFFSKTPLTMPGDFKGKRIFAGDGDPAQLHIFRTFGYRPVVINVTDVPQALQSGMIDAVLLPTMWSLVYQIDRAAPNMLHVNWAPVVGATIMTLNSWNAMTPEVQEVLRAASMDAAHKLHEHRRKLDADAISAMQSRGLHVHETTPEVDRAWRELAQTSWKHIRGNTVPADVFDRVQDLLAEYRSRAAP